MYKKSELSSLNDLHSVYTVSRVFHLRNKVSDYTVSNGTSYELIPFESHLKISIVE